MTISRDFVHCEGSATIGDALRAYLDQDGQWWWLLIAEIEGECFVCSFGSLLQYLTGRTPHILHTIGDSAICSGIDPLLWANADALVKDVLADATVCSRTVSGLPMAALPIVEAEKAEGHPIGSWPMGKGERACGVTENGVLSGVYIPQTRDAPAGLPGF